MADLLQQHRPDQVLMLGLAAGEQALRLEQVALNLDNAESPDNGGEVRQCTRIVEQGPVGYWSTLPLAAMARQAGRIGEAVQFSHDAGGFVCNHVFFSTLHRLARAGGGSRGGFVHLPPLDTGERLVRVAGLVRTWIEDFAAGRSCQPPR